MKNFPTDPREPEPAELRELQAAYRRRLQADTHVFHQLTSSEALEGSVLRLRDDLTLLRRGVRRWAVVSWYSCFCSVQRPLGWCRRSAGKPA